MTLRSLGRACVLAGLTAVLTGCSSYTVRFELEHVINAPGADDFPRYPLQVDVVMLDKNEVEQFPEIASGRKSSRDWFLERRTNIAGIDPAHVWAWRSGDEDPGMDTKVGNELVSLAEPGATTPAPISFRPPSFDSDALLLVYGGFRNTSNEYTDEPPIRLSPLSKYGRNIVVRVGRTKLVLQRTE